MAHFLLIRGSAFPSVILEILTKSLLFFFPRSVKWNCRFAVEPVCFNSLLLFFFFFSSTYYYYTMF